MRTFAQPGVPESFNVLLKELQSLGLAVELLNEEERSTLPLELTETLGLEDGLEGGSEDGFGPEEAPNSDRVVRPEDGL